MKYSLLIWLIPIRSSDWDLTSRLLHYH